MPTVEGKGARLSVSVWRVCVVLFVCVRVCVWFCLRVYVLNNAPLPLIPLFCLACVPGLCVGKCVFVSVCVQLHRKDKTPL